MTEHEAQLTKTCMYCGQKRPLSEFRRRTGKRAGPGARRGACRYCRQLGGQADNDNTLRDSDEAVKSHRGAPAARPSASTSHTAEMIVDAANGMPSIAATSERRGESKPSVGSSSSKEGEKAVLAASSTVSSPSGNLKKRRRRRKAKRPELQSGKEQTESLSRTEVEIQTAGPGADLQNRDSQVITASADPSAKRASARTAAGTDQAAEQELAAANALLPAKPQGLAAEPGAADQPTAAKRKRKRRRKRAAALPSGAGQARSIAEASAPSLSDRGDANTVAGSAAAAAQPAAAAKPAPGQAPETAKEAAPPAPVRQPGSPGSKPRPARKERAPKAGGEDTARAGSSGQRAPAHSSRSHGAGMESRPRRHTPAVPVAIDPEDPASLRTNRQGMVRMRGKTDKGRRWHQEVDMELAVTLVKEKAAVVVNRYTIRRLFSNKDFKRFILTRDNYTCYFCGSYGDTIDHLLPRAKGGHTTPLNCVCACNLCNQSKAAMDAEEFMRSGIPEWNAAHQEELNALAMQEAQLE
ncbi:HNH endonuclease [Paenibacillus pabuli]|uniref:HNH endonuclease n=1 Tax=Paenibacillus pabuli TaxID=1472 RepID=UPI001FFEF794|nr:HNH endonuclease [Paenibacillus pabuli]